MFAISSTTSYNDRMLEVKACGGCRHGATKVWWALRDGQCLQRYGAHSQMAHRGWHRGGGCIEGGTEGDLALRGGCMGGGTEGEGARGMACMKGVKRIYGGDMVTDREEHRCQLSRPSSVHSTCQSTHLG